MTSRSFLAPLLCAAALAAACKPAMNDEQRRAGAQAHADSAKAAIRAGWESWVRYTNAAQPESLATLFAANGMIIPPDVKPATGPDSIVARYRTLIAPGGRLTITSENTSVVEDMAVDRGGWTYIIPAQGRAPELRLAGNYLAHWHRDNGQWKVAETIWNNDSMTRPPMPRS